MYGTSKEAKEHYGVSTDTLRRWANNGKIETIRTKGNHRRYFIPDNNGESFIYARVSSSEQAKDLETQVGYLQKRYPDHTVVKDIGSGISFKRKGLRKILDKVFNGDVKEVVVASEDRLSRFGFELFELLFKRFGTEIKVIKSKKYKSPEQELSEDLLSIITIFTAKYHGSGRYS